MDVDLEQLAARVQVLEDREAIWRLQMDYRRYLDERDWHGFASLFAEDGEWRGPMGSAVGPAAIETFVSTTLPTFEVHERTYHLIANTVIDVDGDTGVAESTQCYVVRDDDDAPVVAHIGRYDDTLVRVDGTWRFKLRLAAYDIPYQRPADAESDEK